MKQKHQRPTTGHDGHDRKWSLSWQTHQTPSANIAEIPIKSGNAQTAHFHMDQTRYPCMTCQSYQRCHPHHRMTDHITISLASQSRNQVFSKPKWICLCLPCVELFACTEPCQWQVLTVAISTKGCFPLAQSDWPALLVSKDSWQCINGWLAMKPKGNCGGLLIWSPIGTHCDCHSTAMTGQLLQNFKWQVMSYIFTYLIYISYMINNSSIILEHIWNFEPSYISYISYRTNRYIWYKYIYVSCAKKKTMQNIEQMNSIPKTQLNQLNIVLYIYISYIIHIRTDCYTQKHKNIILQQVSLKTRNNNFYLLYLQCLPLCRSWTSPTGWDATSNVCPSGALELATLRRTGPAPAPRGQTLTGRPGSPEGMFPRSCSHSSGVPSPAKHFLRSAQWMMWDTSVRRHAMNIGHHFDTTSKWSKTALSILSNTHPPAK